MARPRPNRKKGGRRKAPAAPVFPWSSSLLFQANELSGGGVTQTVRDPIALRSAAMPAYDVLGAVLQRVASMFADGVFLTEPSADDLASKLGDDGPSVVTVLAPVKSEKRCAEKVASDYDGWDQLLDLVRGSISVRSLGQLRVCIEALRGALRAKDCSICGRLKNRMELPAADGYRDIMLRIRTADGFVCELQFHLHGMLRTKNDSGHHYYELVRTQSASYESRLRAASTDEEKDVIRRTAPEPAEMKKLNALQFELYTSIWQTITDSK